MPITEWRLWGVAILTFGIGDTGLTLYVLARGGTELSPVPAGVFAAYGALGLVGLKLAAFACFSLLAWGVPRAWPDCSEDVWRWGVPLVVSVLGLFVTSWNLVALRGVGL